MTAGKTEWFIVTKDGKKGPYSSIEMKQLARRGKIASNTQVWKEGLKQPVAARRIQGLFVKTSLVAQPKLKKTEEAKQAVAASTQNGPADRKQHSAMVDSPRLASSLGPVHPMVGIGSKKNQGKCLDR